MNILLATASLILSLGFIKAELARRHDRYAYIQRVVCDVKFPDLLCQRKTHAIAYRMFRLIPVRCPTYEICTDYVDHEFNTTAVRSDCEKYALCSYGPSGYVSSDVFILQNAFYKLFGHHEIEELAYELFVRLVSSFLDSCTYPKSFESNVEKCMSENQELVVSPLAAFIKLISRRSTRDVVLIVLSDFLDYLKKEEGHGFTKDRKSNQCVTLTQSYFHYLTEAVRFIEKKIAAYTLIPVMDERRITSVSAIMISSKFANTTGNYVIDATSFMDYTIPF
uniref:Spore wall protein 1 n=1 Tax=Nosema pernyi TaxID=1112939 RepID=A0A060A4C2_9MICR|nr:spore wall protein 1 [Nosema pernyi]